MFVDKKYFSLSLKILHYSIGFRPFAQLEFRNCNCRSMWFFDVCENDVEHIPKFDYFSYSIMVHGFEN
jgi:hypothetical protein